MMDCDASGHQAGGVYSVGDRCPSWGDAFWVAPTACVVGSAHIGHRVSIWFAATVRADDEQVFIGDGTNIQDGAVLHSDPGFPLLIGRNVTVGHGALVHGCTIGDNCLIGMGACIMNGATVGPNCVVGAGALITEGKTFGEGSLIVGSPAKSVRHLSPDAFGDLSKGAEEYVGKARRYAAGLRRLHVPFQHDGDD